MTPLVAVFNSSPDTIELLRVVLQQAGFVVASAFTYQIRDGIVDLGQFMRQHQPDVVIYDVAPPYDANWAPFLRLRRNPSMCECQFVVTSTNAGYDQQLAGRDQRVYEIIGKPLDLDEIVRATKEALRSRPTS